MGESNDNAPRQRIGVWSDLKMEVVSEPGELAYIIRREIRDYHDSLKVLDRTIRRYGRKAKARRPAYLKIVE